MKRKLLSGLFFLAGIAATLHAQDVIIKENGEEIQAKVIEVGTNEIKYKRLDNESGPTYIIPKSELFLIKYADGTKEVIEKSTTPTATPAPVQQSYTAPAPVSQPVQTTSFSSSSSSNNDYDKNNFELDLSIPLVESLGFDLGIGWLHNFSRYFGWDIIRLQIGNSFENFDIEYTSLRLQTGPKVYFTPVSNSISPFLAFRVGYGASVDDFENGQFHIAPEIGVNLSHSFYLAVGYSHSWGTSTYYTTERKQTGTKSDRYYSYIEKRYIYITTPVYSNVEVEHSDDLSKGNFFFRLGFNF
jgi:hypothetical protein